MNRILSVILLLAVTLGASWHAQKQTSKFDDFMSQLASLERDFCSTNIAVAESGLLRHREWLWERSAAGESYHHNLFLTDARLFQIYEFKGETNKAETFYEEGAQAYGRYIRSQHRLEDPISREQIREQLGRQQKGQKVGWKFGGVNVK